MKIFYLTICNWVPKISMLYYLSVQNQTPIHPKFGRRKDSWKPAHLLSVQHPRLQRAVHQQGEGRARKGLPLQRGPMPVSRMQEEVHHPEAGGPHSGTHDSCQVSSEHQQVDLDCEGSKLFYARSSKFGFQMN